MFLKEEEFAQLVSISPLISIDICILNDDKLLLGKRKNSPAKNFYFVPGGRIRKNESIDCAVDRLLREELGLKFKENKKNKKKFIGIFEHFYGENFLENSLFDTHYVVIAFLIRYENIEEIFNLADFHDQHSKYIWYDFVDTDNKELEIHNYSQDYLEYISNNIYKKRY